MTVNVWHNVWRRLPVEATKVAAGTSILCAGAFDQMYHKWYSWMIPGVLGFALMDLAIYLSVKRERGQ